MEDISSFASEGGWIFFNERQLARCRSAARQLSAMHELTFSLGFDNGLRCIDQQRLTTKNVED
jgi:hypothetical protein